MDKETRSQIDSATRKARRLLEDDFAAQLEGDFDILADGHVGAKASKHLKPRQVFARNKIVAAIERKRQTGLDAKAAVADCLRDAAFTTLNRFVALMMLEARDLVQPCVSKGEESSGYLEYCGMAAGVKLLPDGQGYRIYLESIFDELSTEVKVLFDRRDPASVLWPKRSTLAELLDLLHAPALAAVWAEDETIGWVYQYFNALEERMALKDTKAGGAAAPRNSRELATRNQFFTPRYVVQFLTDNALGRLWWEMRGGDTKLVETCSLLALAPDDVPPTRPKKDPRDLRVLDPACGSGHFLLYVFDLLLAIYEEAWADPAAPTSTSTGHTLHDDFGTIEELRRACPKLIIEHNLYGVDIDPRCVQVASFALWLRAQRAWRDWKVARTDRASVERSQVVLAEPVGTDDALLRAFAATLAHPVLSELFEALVADLRLAGDLGVLLKAETSLADAVKRVESSTRQGALWSDSSTTADFWSSAEARLLAALTAFVEGTPGRDLDRRRMFRHDAANSLAFLDLIQTRFDVALMNPPFGDPSEPSKEYIEDRYEDSRQDLAAVFVERCVRHLVPEGFVGVLSTEAGFFRRTLEPWRRMLLESGRLSVLAHLGGHVLDGATVRVAAYCIRSGDTSGRALCVRLLHETRDVRADKLAAAVAAVRDAGTDSNVFLVDQTEFQKLPYAVFAYWCSREMREAFVRHAALDPAAGIARQGVATADDFRFLRLRWELPPEQVGGDCWIPFAKGGEYSPYVDDVHLTLAWHLEGRALIAWGHGRPQNLELFGELGITWPRRTNKRFAPRAFPAGCAFGDKGPVVVRIPSSPWALLAYLNSRVAGYLMSFGTGAVEVEGGTTSNSYEVGLVQRLPVPASLPSDETLSELARVAWETRAERLFRDETAAMYAGPAAPVGFTRGLAATWDAIWQRELALLGRYVDTQVLIDHRVIELLGLGPSDLEEVIANVGAPHRPTMDEQSERAMFAQAVVSFLVGCAFGRWSPDRLGRANSLSTRSAFDAPQAHVDDDPTQPGVLADDPHHRLDLAHRCELMLEKVVGARATVVLPELLEMLGASDLRPFLRNKFFDLHWTTYSKSKRSAALYLPLGTPSGSYTVWLYLHRVGPGTLFEVDELLEDKLRSVETRAFPAKPTSDEPPDARDARELARELRELLVEVRRVKPLWKPFLEDGVLITFAPLWRLFPHLPAWQKELRATWDALCRRDYDWSHTAMHLWPVEVLTTCRGDRSIAIAHGLEAELWEQDAKGKWKPRKEPARTEKQLIAERLSAAVIEARDSLIAAVASGAGTPRKPRRRAAPKARWKRRR